MYVGKEYEIVLYAGNVSRTIRGALIAAVTSRELRRYGHLPQHLQVKQHPLQPKGSEYEWISKPWYIIQEENGDLTPIYENWIKPNGITEVAIKDIVIEATFKSGRPMETIEAAFVREGILNTSLVLDAGQNTGGVVVPEVGVQYKLTLSDSDNSSIWGVYNGTVSYGLLSSMGLSGELEYASYSWPTDHSTLLSKYQWLIFETISSGSRMIAIPDKLIADGPYETSSQGIFTLTKSGTLADVAHIRSTLNILSATDITIGTKS